LIISHYRDHATAYANATRDVDMSPVHARFLAHMPASAKVLDAGCGSGRDALAFQRAGHQVAAFDASPELARLASEHTGLPVCVTDFLSLDAATPLGLPPDARFHGIWACASLLHVAEADQAQAWARLWAWLAPGGVVYASYKLGEGERVDESGRPFTDATERRLRAWIGYLDSAREIETWVTTDQRQDSSERWMNALVFKQAGSA